MSSQKKLKQESALGAPATSNIRVTVWSICALACGISLLVVLSLVHSGFSIYMRQLGILVSGVALPLSALTVCRKYRQWERLGDPTKKQDIQPLIVSIVTIALVLSVSCVMLVLPKLFDIILGAGPR